MRWILVLALLWSTGAAAQQSRDTADADTMQSFIRGTAADCLSKRAQTCIDAGWRFAAASPERGLTLQDLVSLRRRLGAWFGRYHKTMRQRERNAVAVGLLVADGIGVEVLHAAFDSDRNGHVTQRELLADVTLDDRPLGAVLTDAEAVDRAGLSRRLGMPEHFVETLFD